MIFGWSTEQEELRKMVRRFMENKSASSDVRRLMETPEGYDPAVWSQMADELGLQALIIPEKFGGAGFGYVELVIVMEEMGRALLCSPFFSTIALAANALLSSTDEVAKGDYLPGIASGDTIATLAYTEAGGKWDLESIRCSATHSDGQWLISGEKSFIVDGNLATLILVAARTPGGVSLFAVDGEASGLSRTSQPTLDQTRKQAELVFAATPGRLIGEEGSAGPALERTMDLAAVALAAEQAGGAQKVLDMSIEYAKDRIQFGRPIGSFQVIKHMCANMLLEVESAKSAAHYAGWTAAEDGEDLGVSACLAKAYCSEAYFHAAGENIQIHGGIGFTWEHDAHLHFKRAKSSEIMLGDPAYHRNMLVDRIGI
jgi:alkylation response protein AidB-like acyl-CoA dehydrogenase